jgi:hypothetical protein
VGAGGGVEKLGVARVAFYRVRRRGVETTRVGSSLPIMRAPLIIGYGSGRGGATTGSGGKHDRRGQFLLHGEGGGQRAWRRGGYGRWKKGAWARVGRKAIGLNRAAGPSGLKSKENPFPILIRILEFCKTLEIDFRRI